MRVLVSLSRVSYSLLQLFAVNGGIPALLYILVKSYPYMWAKSRAYILQDI
jgi:hypothetical protein